MKPAGALLAGWLAAASAQDRYQGVPPFPETHDYVRRVLGRYGSVRHAFDEN